jgi:hypothetical protein
MALEACMIPLRAGRVAAFHPGASRPPPITAIVHILLMISRLSLPMIVPESVLAPEPPVERLLFC